MTNEQKVDLEMTLREHGYYGKYQSDFSDGRISEIFKGLLDEIRIIKLQPDYDDGYSAGYSAGYEDGREE